MKKKKLHFFVSIIPAAVRLQKHWVSVWLRICMSSILPVSKQSLESIRMLYGS